MLILPDSSYLGDTLLSPTEGVAKLKEDTAKLVDPKKLANQSDLENAEMSQGTAMAPSEFINRLAKLNPEIIVEKGGYPGAVAVRLVKLDDDRQSPTYGIKVKKYITGFFVNEVLAEFSRIIPGPNGLPSRHIRGWRTVLLDLFHAGALTYPQIKAAFGEPLGQRNGLWMQQTQSERA